MPLIHRYKRTSSNDKRGLKCPVCLKFVSVSIYKILHKQIIHCPECNTKIVIDDIEKALENLITEENNS